MELSKKETYRNKKVSLGVTVLSFVVMLVFFIFTNFITANPMSAGSNNSVNSPQLSLSMDAGSFENSGSSKQEVLNVPSTQQHASSKIQTAPSEIPLDQGLSDIIKKYSGHKFSAVAPNTTAEMNDPGTSEGDKEGAKATGGGESKKSESAMVYSLGRRTILARPNIQSTAQAAGTVVVDITVDKSGKVIDANPNGRGTTTSNPALKSDAAKIALATKFNAEQTIEEQRGTITIIFSFE